MSSVIPTSIGTAPSPPISPPPPNNLPPPKASALSSLPLPDLSTTILQRFCSLEGINAEPTPQDIQEAERLANIQRSTSDNNRKWSVSSSLSYKDSNAVLEQISLGRVPSATPGLVLALIENGGADVCFSRMKSTSIFKSIQGIDQEDVRSRVLENAARHCSDEIFHILARYADEAAMQQAFPITIAVGHPLKVMILMARGADASSYCKEFLAAVASGAAELVETLLKDGGKGACQSCRDKGLVLAANRGYETKGYILLSKGADPTYENGSALFEATRRGFQLFAMRIASAYATGPRKLHHTLMDTVVGEAYGLKQYQLVQVCLEVGAMGDATNRALIEAVERQQVSLVEVMAQYGASISYEGGLSLRLAVRSGNPQILAGLLRGGPSRIVPGIVGAALMETTMLRDVKVAISMMDMLLDANTRGDSVTEVLIQALNHQVALGSDRSRASIAHLFCSKGRADVNAYAGICLTGATENGWIETFRVLSRSQPSLRSLKSALVPAMATSDHHLRQEFLKIILEAGPGGDNDGEGGLLISAFKAAAGHLLLDIMQLIETQVGQIPDSALTHAWNAATQAGKENEWTQPQGLKVMVFLLERGVAGQVVEDAFCRAVPTCSQEVIETLDQFVQVSTTFSRALCSLAESPSTQWTLDENLWLISSLLDWGCDANSVNMALISAVKAYVSGGGSETVVEVLLTQSGSANINFQGGEALQIAVRSGKVSLLELLLPSGEVERATMTRVFASAITSSMEESSMVRILEILARHKGSDNKKVGFDIHLSIGRGIPPIAACLEVNPGYAMVVKRLIKLGCDPEAQFRSVLYAEEKFDENTTVLLWACRLPKVSILVINELIDAKANVNFTSTVSKTTPLLVASRSGRSDIVGKLLDAGAKVTAQDQLQFTALNWSSRVGDLATVKTLIKAKARPNDGSLHDAARKMHSKVVATLIKAKHSVDFPCSKDRHEGRTALQELCLRANGALNLEELHDTVEALHAGGCDLFREYHGRNSLFLALENVADPFSMTEKLLDVAIWKVIDDERNIFRTNPTPTGTTTCYSATVFLESPFYQGRGDPQKILKLKELLRSKGCRDRYYEIFGPGDSDKLQRDDAIGLPSKIEDMDNKRREKLQKRRDETIDHNNKMQRKREEAEQNLFIKDRVHYQEINQSHATHQTKMNQKEQELSQKLDGDTQVHVQKVQQSNVVHQNRIHQDAETANQKLQIDSRKHAQHAYHSNMDHQNKIAQQQAVSDQQTKALQRKQVMTQSAQRDAEMHKMRNAYIDVKAREIGYQQKLEFKQAQHQQKLGLQRDARRIRES